MWAPLPDISPQWGTARSDSGSPELEPLKLLPNKQMHGVGVDFHFRGLQEGLRVCGESVFAVELAGTVRLIS